MDPATNQLVEGGAAAQTKQALMNLSKALAAAESGMPLCLKTTVFVANPDDFAAVNGVYAAFVTEAKKAGTETWPMPARSMVGVAALPMKAAVMIDAVAVQRVGGLSASSLQEPQSKKAMKMDDLSLRKE